MTRICVILLSVLGLAVANVEAGAQAWPTRPIRAIVAFSAGGIVDVIARVVFDQLSIQLRQPVVVENRAGAGTTIAAAFVAKSDPDGYTMLVNSSAHTISPSLQPNLTFDPARDFSAVIPLGNSPNVLVVSPSRGLKTVGDLVAAAKAKPGSFNFASAGVGSGVHMSAERFLASAGIVAVHVPFKGSPEAITEVMAGRVDFYFSPVGLVVTHIREGKLLALAVNSPKSAIVLPEVPTLAEAGVADAEYPLCMDRFSPPGRLAISSRRFIAKRLKP
jgi:tripartite-type tricarboxylate transporter receptor subunit TctC